MAELFVPADEKEAQLLRASAFGKIKLRVVRVQNFEPVVKSSICCMAYACFLMPRLYSLVSFLLDLEHGGDQGPRAHERVGTENVLVAQHYPGNALSHPLVP
jgi:hypothetical protein